MGGAGSVLHDKPQAAGVKSPRHEFCNMLSLPVVVVQTATRIRHLGRDVPASCRIAPPNSRAEPFAARFSSLNPQRCIY